MEIGAALGATGCQTIQEDHLINKGRIGKKSNGSATELYPTSPHFFRAGALGLQVGDYENVTFYAAWSTPALHDTYTGIRINTSAQAIDLRGKVIPGLHVCGDSAGGFGQHGICRAATFSRIAGFHAAQQTVVSQKRVVRSVSH